MKRFIILFLLIVVSMSVSSVVAQVKQYKALSDTTVVKYLRGGYVRDGKLHLTAKDNYSTLDLNRKKELLYKISREFPDMDIVVYEGEKLREVWMVSVAGVFLMEKWSIDDLQLENYKPLALKRSGNSKVFYYVGGSYNKSDTYSNGSLNLRGGTYLYKNTIDISATISIGYVSLQDSSFSSRNISIDNRYYLPYRPKKVNLTPYAGAGLAWTFKPENYIEPHLLLGACWFVGPGNLDLGVQYGRKSGVTATIGYTFRP